MKSKQQKQNKNNEIIMLFQNKSQLLFFKYNSNHPQTIQSSFSLGKISLFYKEKVYETELKSIPHLNPNLDWNKEIFQLLLKRFEYFEIQEEEYEFNLNYYLIVSFNLKGKNILLFRCKLQDKFACNQLNQLWNQFEKYNKFILKDFQKKEKTVQELQKKIDRATDRIELIQKEEQKSVNKMKGMLSVLLHQKQKKLMQLSGNKHKFVYNLENKSKQKQLKVKSEVINWISSQDDRMIMGSLFAPSQDFGV